MNMSSVGSLDFNHETLNDTIMAYPNACSRHCDTKLIIFLIILFLVVATESLCLTPATMTILKLIEKPLQPFALGVLRCANILIGKLFDFYYNLILILIRLGEFIRQFLINRFLFERSKIKIF